MLQLDQGEDASLHLKNLFSETGRLQLETEAIPAACQKGAWQGESTLRQRDGKELPVSQVVIAHKDPAGQITSISIVARDISGQKLAEEEREKLQAQLAQARKMESVGRLAGGVAHDFNNMLQVILSNVELALMDVPRGSPLHADLMEIRRSAERSASLTRQLLAFARKQPVSPRVLDLNETVGGMLKMLERLIGESIRLEWVPGKDLWPVRMDPAQVDQILANLAVNARDAITGEGKLTVQTANVVFSEADGRRPKDCPAGEYVELMVMDNGQGMPPDVLDHLFEPFFTTKGVGQGTGLGLATVFGIVKQNGGTVAVESQLNQGTTFRIYLPRCRSQASAEETKPPSLRGGTETVLLVEDEPQILQLARRALEGQGYTVLAASLPGAALDLARGYSGRIDLLISDIVMPGMNGKDLRQQLEPICPQMKCLFMSGYTADIIARHGDVNPGEPFIQKPFTLQDLTEKVRVVLRS
jgi:signal transduction histidine kinase